MVTEQELAARHEHGLEAAFKVVGEFDNDRKIRSHFQPHFTAGVSGGQREEQPKTHMDVRRCAFPFELGGATP
jgi:hypothetical protein